MRSHERNTSGRSSATRDRLPAPQPGDVLVSERAARADIYDISLVPADPHMIVRRYDEAIKVVRDLARERKVDGWCTVDQTHYAQVATYRTTGG
jgi:hypothetical protein